jgi:pimeloyl-ACP methyl ester carboxylesterase
LQLALDAPDLVQSLALLEPVVASGPLADEFGRTAVGPAFGRYAAGDRAGAADLFLQGVGGPEYRTLVAQTLGASALEQLERDLDTFFQVEGPAVNAWQFDSAVAARVQPPVLLLVGERARGNDGLQKREGLHEIGRIQRQLQSDAATGGVAHHVSARDTQVLQQQAGVAGLVGNAQRRGCSRAAREADAMIADEPIPLT